MNYNVDNNPGALMEEGDVHYLGEFANVYEAMKRYPSGGLEGDYIVIFGVKHFWNVNRQSWGSLRDREDNLVYMLESGLSGMMLSREEMKEWVAGQIEKANGDMEKYVDKCLKGTLVLSVALIADPVVLGKGSGEEVTLDFKCMKYGKAVVPDSVKLNGVETAFPVKVRPEVTTEYELVVSSGDESAQDSVTVRLVSPSFWGVVGADYVLSGDSVKADFGDGFLKASKSFVRSGITLENEKMCYAYPKEMGMLDSIKDGNGFECLTAYTMTEMETGGEGYYVYLTDEAVTGNNVEQNYR